MTYQLVFSQTERAKAAGVSLPGSGETVLGIERDVGENVFLDNLPGGYKVFVFYYPAEISNPKLENNLRALGNSTGQNLYVNIGKRNDPNFRKIVEQFGIDSYPVIVMTAVADLAASDTSSSSAFVRLDSSYLLDFPERTVQCVEQLFNLFLQGRIAEAIAKARWTERRQLAATIGSFVVSALKSVGRLIDSRDIEVSILEGKFVLKHSGG